MAKFLFIFTLIGLLFSCQSRLNGFSLLNQVKDQIEQKNNVKALALLKKVDKANFGSCGNAYAEGLAQAKLLESMIYRSENNYSKSLKVLDDNFNCSLGADCSTRDSLKVENLLSIYGKDKVINSFHSNKFERDTVDYFANTFKINLKELNYNFVFHNSSEFFDENYIPINPSNIDSLNLIIEQQKFYQLIK